MYAGAPLQKSNPKAFAFDTSSPLLLVAVEAGRYIEEVIVVVDTVFDGAAPTVSVGDSGDNSRLVSTVPVNLKALGATPVAVYFKYVGATTINLYITPSTASQGEGHVIVRHSPIQT